MYKSFKIRNFRCFDEITLSSLERINLITGMNNAGKTSILEALFLHMGGYNPSLIITLHTFRGFERFKLEFAPLSETPWDSLFKDYKQDTPIELIGKNGEKFERTITLREISDASDLRELSKSIRIMHSEPEEISLQTSEISLETAKVLEMECKEQRRINKYYLIIHKKGIQTGPISPSPPFPGFYQSDRTPILSKGMAERFGKLEKFGKQDIVLKALQVIEPKLKRIAMLVLAEQPVLHGDFGLDRLVPISLMGGGIVRLANLITYIGNAENGVVLVDEIENGFHYSIMPKVWKSIAEAARQFNTQIFATTHSWECIVSAHNSFIKERNYDFKLHRIESTDHKTIAVNYDKASLQSAIDAGLEVR